MYCTNCGNQQSNIHQFCTNCGGKLIKTLPQPKNKKSLPIIIGVILGFLVIVYIWNWLIGYEDEPAIASPSNFSQTFNFNQVEVVASVVNIFCSSSISDEYSSGGSGTILSEDGLILTNSHIIPQDEEHILTSEYGCLVVLPDPITGYPDELFWAEPIVIPELSDEYDLAFMQIYDAYYDEEDQEYAGTYPRDFPAFDDTNRCLDEDFQLGEPVRIFGYPTIGGGNSLTITDGVLSSFLGDGLITTSAKIGQGNSGGLAVDRNGCMIGVPSMVSFDEHESLGVIISTPLMYEFLDELEFF